MRYVSVASFSFSIVKETLRKQNSRMFKNTSTNMAEFIASSYFGGRCDFTMLGEYVSEGELCYLDVTSEYSVAMTGLYPMLESDKDYQVGYDIDVEKIQDILNECTSERAKLFSQKLLHTDYRFFEKLNQIKGIFLCDIIPPPEEQLSTFAPVATRIMQYDGTSRLFFQNFKRDSIAVNTVNMRCLIYTGWTIRLIPHQYNIIFYRSAKILKPFIDIIGERKTKARETNKAYAKLLKLVMNSAQGKFAQKASHDSAQQTGENVDGNYNMLENTRRKNMDYKNCFHYIATFIGAEANWILFHTLYNMELHKIYDNLPLSMRCGTYLYVDTDSIVYDDAKISHYDTLEQSEEIGYWIDENQNYKIYWKKKKKNLTSIIVIAKKCYALIKKGEVKEKKIKGVPTRQKRTINYPQLKKMANNSPYEFEYSGLAKQVIPLSVGAEYLLNPSEKIIITENKRKTIKMTRGRFTVDCTDEKTLAINKHSLEREPYDADTKHFLVFICSDVIDTSIERVIEENIMRVTDEIVPENEEFFEWSEDEDEDEAEMEIDLGPVSPSEQVLDWDEED